MKRIGITSLAWSAVLLLICAGAAGATPTVNGATIELRTFNDCPISTVTSTNNYPALIRITDTMDSACVGFANLHSFSLSADGGATSAVFNNNSNFHVGADINISGAGQGEGGLRISPWYGKFVDGRFMANATTGEIACFGGALPFYSFTGNHGISYVKGTTIRLEATYRAHDLSSGDPASIQYRVVYNNTTYDSPVLPFGEQNPNECKAGGVYHGLWGMLNDGRVGGYFQPRANTGAALTATWTNIDYCIVAAVGTPLANGATIETRTFNDCPLSTLTTTNSYPASIEITDTMDTLCVGFANLHSFSFSEDGGATAAVFNNNSHFKFSADVNISGAGQGEGGLRISPWYGKFVDGRFMANVTTGEIACFGGALPFYSFTGNHGITYTRGTTIHLEVTYQANELVPTAPATIQYRVVYNNTTYDSPVLPFGEQNPNECRLAGVYNGLWGMLNDGRAGGYFQPRANTGASLTMRWSDIQYNGDLDPDQCNKPPDCSQAAACVASLWPPNHAYHPVSICGVTDPDGDPVTITATGITQDEPLNTRGDGNTCPDGQIVNGEASVRAERTGTPGIPGNGRVYVISFTASDGRGGECRGSVSVCVPHDQGQGASCIDDGQKYNSLGPCNGGTQLSQEVAAIGLTVGQVTANQAVLEFSLPQATPVELSVFDVAGRRLATVANEAMEAGVHQRAWDMGSTSKGLYFVRLRAGGVTLTRTVVKAR